MNVAKNRPISALWFVLPAVMAYLVCFGITAILAEVPKSHVVAAAITTDLLVVIPGLYFFVFVRRRDWPAVTLAPVFLLSFGAASVIVPDEHQGLLNGVAYALPAVELLLLGYVGYRVYVIAARVRSTESAESDYYERLRNALHEALPVTAVADVIAFEVALLRYALWPGRTSTSTHHLTYRHSSGYSAVFAAILIVVVVELVAVHLLLRTWSQPAAIIHLILGIYAIIWLIGDFRAMRARPHELIDDKMTVRCGLRWNVEVPLDQIAAVRRTKRAPKTKAYLNAAPIGDPTYIIDLARPMTAFGPYGITRTAEHLGITVDDSEAFEDRLRVLGVRIEA